MARTEPRVILIGLGNPGPDYAGTRHNAGFLFADYLARTHGFESFEPMDGAEAVGARGQLADMPVLLVKPTTAMNDCGRVVPPLFERCPPDDCLYAIAHDDLDLSIGSVKGRQKGGPGGHNGVRSILAAAGRRDLVRVKLGVNSTRKRSHDSVADFLLSEFHPNERGRLEDAFPEAEQVLVGQIKSFAARLDKQDRHRDVARRYREEVLPEVREAVANLPAVSPYPVFIRRERWARARDVVTALTKLLRRARALAAKDDAFYGDLLRFIPEHLRDLLPEGRDGGRVFFGADLHVTDEALKVIELNCAVGYGHYAAMADQAVWPILERDIGGLDRPAEGDFASFLWRHGLRPLHEPEHGAIAFLRGFGNRDMFNVDEIEGVARGIEEDGGPHVPLCHEGELELTGDGLHLSGTGRIDLLYVEENLSEWDETADDSPVARAVRDGLVKTFPPLDAFLYTSKGFLSLLSDPAVWEKLRPDEAERKVLRENVLWSQPLDRHVEPAAYYMLEQGLPLVVKDALGGGGRGVTILRPGSASQEAGHILRRRMRDGQSVVQGYFEAGRWSEDSNLRFDVRVLAAAHEGDVNVGPVYGRVFRDVKLSLSEPDAGVAPVYLID